MVSKSKPISKIYVTNLDRPLDILEIPVEVLSKNPSTLQITVPEGLKADVKLKTLVISCGMFVEESYIRMCGISRFERHLQVANLTHTNDRDPYIREGLVGPKNSLRKFLIQLIEQ